MCLPDVSLFQILQNVPEANINTRISKGQIKKQLNKSLKNGEQHENKELQDNGEKVGKNDEAAEIIRKFKYIIRSKN